MWPGAPRSIPDGSFLVRAALVLLARAHVAWRLSVLCSSWRREQPTWRLSTPRSKCTIPLQLLLPTEGTGRGARRWPGSLASGAHAGCRPPPSMVRRQPRARPGAFLARQAERAYEPHVRSALVCIPSPPAVFGRLNKAGGAGFLKCGKYGRLVYEPPFCWLLLSAT